MSNSATPFELKIERLKPKIPANIGMKNEKYSIEVIFNESMPEQFKSYLATNWDEHSKITGAYFLPNINYIEFPDTTLEDYESKIEERLKKVIIESNKQYNDYLITIAGIEKTKEQIIKEINTKFLNKNKRISESE